MKKHINNIFYKFSKYLSHKRDTIKHLITLFHHEKSKSQLFRIMTIKKRLLLLSIFQIVIMLLLFFVLVSISAKDITNLVNKNNTKWISIISQEFTTAISSLEAVTKYPVIRINTHPNSTYNYLSNPGQYKSHLLYSELDSNRHFFFTQHPYINLLSIYNMEGVGVTIKNDDKYRYFANSKGPSVNLESEMFESIISGKGNFSAWGSSVFTDNTDISFQDNHQIVGARAIYNTEKFEVIGIILATVDLSDNINLYEKGKLYTDQNYGIFDESGNCLIGDVPIDDFNKLKLKLASHDSIENDTILSTVINKNILTYTVLKNGYYCIIQTPLISLIQSSIEKKIGVFLTLIILTLIIIAITKIIVLSITRPIKKLTDICSNVKDGNFSIIIKDNYKDEISTYILYLNSMTNEIHRLIHEVHHKDLVLVETEMEMLRSQINPHSLYNTLEIIGATAMLHKENEIADMVKLLGVTLRYGVSKSSIKVTVAHEFLMLQAYIDLQRYLYKDRIQYIIYIEDNIKELPIIKLIIQPLVENAFMHGIQSTNAGGIITVFGSMEEDVLIFKVIDNGQGIPDNTVRDLQDYIDNKNNNFNGIGLKNVNRRIKLYYGEPYGVTINSSIGNGTMITVKIPVKEE